MTLESATEFLEKLRVDPEFYESVLEMSMNHFEAAAAKSFEDICEMGFNFTQKELSDANKEESLKPSGQGEATGFISTVFPDKQVVMAKEPNGRGLWFFTRPRDRSRKGYLYWVYFARGVS